VADLKDLLVSAERRAGEINASVLHAAEEREILERLAETRSADYAYALTNQGVSLLAARHPLAALSALEQAEKLNLEVLGRAHLHTVIAHFNRSMALAYAGKTQQALAALDEWKDPIDSQTPPWWIEYARGTVTRLAGQPRAAIDALKRAAAQIPDDPSAPWDRWRVLTELGQAQLDAGMLDAADSTLAAAETLKDQLRIEMHPAYADLVVARARIDFARGVPARALPKLQRVEAYWHQFDPDNHWAGECARWVAEAYRRLGRPAEASEASARAARLLALPLQ
jgi:tetratricopeptide (TPR) repeat protein